MARQTSIAQMTEVPMLHLEDASPAEFAFDRIVDEPLLAAVAPLAVRAPMLAGMTRYHLGFADAAFEAIDPGTVDRGKRFRPAVALLAAGACGVDPRHAGPVAAAIELLHNFTLIHDDIQDHSKTRRHRPTVWRLWGIAQAINAGDALFAAAHLPLYGLARNGGAPDLALRLAEAFDRTAIEIVEGQTLDLGFETRDDVSAAEYLEMIAAKTAAIVRYAAWAGALLGGASEEAAARWGTFGLELGLGFQIRDDLLGIWGTAADTGKAPADDIRRRKKSLPLLLLRERLDAAGRDGFDLLFADPVVPEETVRRVLGLLEHAGIRAAVEAEIARHHDRARTALLAAAPHPTLYRERLLDLVESLSTRTR